MTYKFDWEGFMTAFTLVFFLTIFFLAIIPIFQHHFEIYIHECQNEVCEDVPVKEIEISSLDCSNLIVNKDYFIRRNSDGSFTVYNLSTENCLPKEVTISKSDLTKKRLDENCECIAGCVHAVGDVDYIDCKECSEWKCGDYRVVVE